MAHENWKKSEFHLEIDMNENEDVEGKVEIIRATHSFQLIGINTFIWNFGFELDNATLNLCRGIIVIDIADLPVLFSISSLPSSANQCHAWFEAEISAWMTAEKE